MIVWEVAIKLTSMNGANLAQITGNITQNIATLDLAICHS